MVILAGYVGADLFELGQLVLHLPRWDFDVGLDSFEEFLVIHLRSCIADDLDVSGEKLVSVQTENPREGLLLCKITRSSENDDNGILLQLNCPIQKLLALQAPIKSWTYPTSPGSAGLTIVSAIVAVQILIPRLGSWLDEFEDSSKLTLAICR